MGNWRRRGWIATFLSFAFFVLFAVFYDRLGRAFHLWLGLFIFSSGVVFIILAQFSQLARKYDVRLGFALLGVAECLTGLGAIPNVYLPALRRWWDTLVFTGIALLFVAVVVIMRAAKKFLPRNESTRE
jgi:drug/metabolite transporter (DMT)-like permease